jgi:hypothetical protein
LISGASSEYDDASIDQMVADASIVLQTPGRNLYIGYLTGNSIPPNGAPFGSGITFPTGPAQGSFFLRTDYSPNVLYRFDGKNWVMFEQDVRMTMNQFGAENVANGVFAGQQIRQTQKAGFINNTNTSTINGQTVIERQSLHQILRPRADR